MNNFEKWYQQRNRRSSSWHNIVPTVVGDNKHSRKIADMLDNAKNSTSYKIFDFFRKKMS